MTPAEEEKKKSPLVMDVGLKAARKQNVSLSYKANIKPKKKSETKQ